MSCWRDDRMVAASDTFRRVWDGIRQRSALSPPCSTGRFLFSKLTLPDRAASVLRASWEAPWSSRDHFDWSQHHALVVDFGPSTALVLLHWYCCTDSAKLRRCFMASIKLVISSRAEVFTVCRSSGRELDTNGLCEHSKPHRSFVDLATLLQPEADLLTRRINALPDWVGLFPGPKMSSWEVHGWRKLGNYYVCDCYAN